jgi:hypothetical protein
MKGQTISVKFDLKVPVEVSEDDLQEWLEFELGANGRMSCENPLCSESLEAKTFTVKYEF